MQKCKSQFHLHLRTRCIFHYLLSKALFIGSTCNAGDPVSIPGLGRSPGEGRGYLLQYSWAFLAAWTVKNLLAMWETWVWSLGQENPLEECMATHSSILVWRIPWAEEPGMPCSIGLQKVRQLKWLSTHAHTFLWCRYKCLKSESESHSVVSDSLRPHVLYSPWISPGQNTGVGRLSLLTIAQKRTLQSHLNLNLEVSFSLNTYLKYLKTLFPWMCSIWKNSSKCCLLLPRHL